VQNLGAANANVTITLTSYDGTKTATLIRQIAPGRSAAIDPSVEPTIAAATEYAGVIASDQPVAAIVNAQNDAPGSIAPMGLSYNAVAQPQSAPVYVPAFARNADGVGRTTRLLIENAGAADAIPSIVLRATSGSQITVTAPAPVRPGASWSYDPRLQPDGRTACPPAGTPTCPAEGTFSGIVQGGAFAVVGASVTATSAMGFVGQSVIGNRAYLPNITRRLGGANGWTTPIVIESAGATSVTMRWYRFADGVLVTRQTLAISATGASITVDPRNVVGLADETQYAVVVDATGGNVAAIVTELNFSGGDGDMAYEGFAATVPTFPVATAIGVAPTSVSVTTGTTAQLTATVKDQFDNPMVGTTVTWTVNPPALGTVGQTGLFTAGQAAGLGTVTATVGAISATATVTVTLPSTRTAGGINFVVQAAGGADLLLESSINSADRTTLTTAAAADIVQIQADFGRAYVQRPQVYVFATTTSYTTGLQTILGVSATDASALGASSTGLWSTFGSVGEAVGVDWLKMRSNLPITAMRHELTHWMEDQIVSTTVIPTWFNEGTARSEEFTVGGSLHNATQNKYGAASMAATNTLFTLEEMTDSLVWERRSGLGAFYQYFAASQAVQFLRSDLGIAGTVRMLDLMRQGQTFEGAYATVSGQPFSAFSGSYATRVRGLAPTYPGIATATDTRVGGGLFIEIFGFTPGSSVTLTITGVANNVPSSLAIDQFGVATTYLDAQWAQGQYTITATSANQSATTNAAKISTFFASAFLDPGVTGPFELPQVVPTIGG